MNINELLKEYGKTYNFLYETHNDLIGIIKSDYAELFSEALTNDQDFKNAVHEAVKIREDVFSSDREAAAFAIAYKVIKRREAIKKLAKQLGYTA